jgi:4-amino-4-deoxy-L-arabinose transferase-like glycosyltransferase
MRRWLEAGVLAGLVAAQAALYAQLLHTAPDFDEGVYLLAVDALRHGQSLGTEVFAAQPPGFYALLRGDAAVFGFGVADMRIGMIMLAAIGAAGAWLLCRTRAGVAAGLLVVALLVIAPPIPLFGARVLADLPALWLALLGIGLAAAAPGRRHATAIAAAAGAVCAFAVLVKLDGGVCIPIAAVLLLAARDRRRLLLAAGAGMAVVALVFLVAHLRALPELWTSVVDYHGDARATGDVIDRWKEIWGLFNLRTPFVWLAAAGLVAFAIRASRRSVDRAELAAWAWVVVAFVFLAVHHPLHYNHLVALPVPLAVATALSLGAMWATGSPRVRAATGAVLVVVVLAGYVQQMRRVQLDDVPVRTALVATAAAVSAATSAEEYVATDEPLVGVLADRRSPGPLVDVAFLRFETGSLDAAEALEAIDEWCVKAAVAGRAFRTQPEILAGLRERFGQVRRIEEIDVYTRRRAPCAP